MSVNFFFPGNCTQGHISLKFTASTMIYTGEYLTTQCTGIYRERGILFHTIGSEI